MQGTNTLAQLQNSEQMEQMISMKLQPILDAVRKMEMEMESVIEQLKEDFVASGSPPS